MAHYGVRHVAGTPSRALKTEEAGFERVKSEGNETVAGIAASVAGARRNAHSFCCF